MKIDTLALRTEAVSQLEQLLQEAEKKLLECWTEVEMAAAQRDKVPKMKIGFNISIDGESREVKYTLNFGLRYLVEADGMLPDPDQLSLGLKPSDQN